MAFYNILPIVFLLSLTACGNDSKEQSNSQPPAVVASVEQAAPKPKFQNEVNGKVFVAKPLAEPIIVKKSGGKIWNCDGLVNEKAINLIYDSLVKLSNDEGIPVPQNSLCHYHISTSNVTGTPIEMYKVAFYTSKDSMKSCLENDYCDNFRTMSFAVLNDKLHFEYLITNADKKITRMACQQLDGRVVNANSGCY